MYTYLHAERAIAADDALSFPTVVVGADHGRDPNIIHAFRSDSEFSKWADRTPHGEKVRDILRLLTTEVVSERRNEAWIESMQRLALDRGRVTFGEFAKLLNRDPRHDEVVRKSMIERSLFTPKVFDPILLYDREIEHEPPTGAPEDSRTNTLPVGTGWWPALGWVGWDNRARSVRHFGVNVLYENNWFGGRKGWLIGFNGLLNLRHIGFDKVASSLISN